MIKTQIQLPDELYRALKRLAEAKEWSLAETLRRAAEQFLARHPVATATRSAWKPPVSAKVGWRGLTHQQVHEAALDDMEPRLPEDRRT
jgi:predicted transcriptional regulator